MMLFTVRRAFDARQWYRSTLGIPAHVAISVARSGLTEWQNDGVNEYDEIEAVEIIGPDGVVLSGNGKGAWWDLGSRTVKDPVGYLRRLEGPSPPDDNITDGAELLRLKALRQAVIDEITWHNNEAAHDREAAAEMDPDDRWDIASLKEEAAFHDRAAGRLRAILNQPLNEMNDPSDEVKF